MASIPPFYYVGFSTVNTPNSNTKLYDIDLINQDLLNAFNTRFGERVMRPDYGCKLWGYLMEPMTSTLHTMIINECERICSLDIRLILNNVMVSQSGHGFRIELSLTYQPWMVTSTFTTTFEQNEISYSQGPLN